MRKKSVLILWSAPSGYMDASMRALVENGNADVFFIGQIPNASVAPFDLDRLKGSYQSMCFEKPTDYEKLNKVIRGFDPDIILAGGSWREPAYRKLLVDFKRKAIRVFCSDAQWQGTMRQWAAIAVMALVRDQLYDRSFVAGERQFLYSKKLGFKAVEIQKGLYSCDHFSFSLASDRSDSNRFKKPSFLFVGRLVDVKGITELLEGYAIYCAETDNPWPLEVCGTGPLEESVRNATSVRYRGFVQPGDLPNIMASHTTLLVPSHLEPWALVIHEAASAGMSIICSAACGAGDAYVEHEKNGAILEHVTSGAIATSLSNISKLNQGELTAMSDVSKKLAAAMTPSIWAEKVLAFSKN